MTRFEFEEYPWQQCQLGGCCEHFRLLEWDREEKSC